DEDRAAASKLAGAGRFGDAVALIRATLAAGTLPDAIREAYPDGAPVPATIGLAASLPWRAIVTTSFDDLWERALVSDVDPGRAPHVLMGTDASASLHNGAGPLLMHLFGRAARPDSLCLGAGDAHERLSLSGLPWLNELRRQRSLVLVGFRPADPDLDWLTSWLSVVPSTETPHFLFLDVSREADPAAEARLVALRTGMTVIPCPGGTAEAMEILADLSADMEAKLAAFDADVDIDAWLARWAKDPSDPEPREVLGRAAAALRFEEDWERLIELLLGRFELLDDRDEQLAALREAATIFRGQLAAPNRALTTGMAALRLAPTDDDLWENLRFDAGAANAWQELFSDGMEVAQAMGPSPDAARIWREIARVARHHLDRPDDAIAAYQGALAAQPQDLETSEELGEMLRQLERWAELVPVLRAAAAATKDPVRASQWVLEAAEIQEDRLGDAAGAISAHEAALAIDPDAERAWVALDRLYEREGRWTDLVALLAGRALRLTPLEAIPLRRRRAQILADQLCDVDTAVRELEALLSADAEAKSDVDVDARATLMLLDRIYQSSDRPADHLRILQRLADSAPHDTERLTVLRRLAEAWRQRPEGLDPAADALEQILRIDPRDAEAFQVLTGVYREAKRPVALADLLARQIELTDPGEGRTALLRLFAEITDKELDDPAKAYDAYQAVEKAGDRSEETYEALVRLTERLQRWDACVEALDRWADGATDPEVRAEILLHAATMQADRLHERDAARARLERVLELAPDHATAMTTLARLCRDAGEFDRTAQLLLQAQQHVPGVTERAELLTEAATIHQDHLGDQDRAIELFVQALEVDSEHVPAGQRLAEVFFSRRQWAEVEPILDMLVPKLEAAGAVGAVDGAAAAVERAAAIHTRLATVAVELGKPEKALASFAEALRYAPDSLQVLSAYAEYRHQRGEWKEARDLYASVLRLHAAALPAGEVLRITMRLGRCEAEQGEAAAAIQWYEKAHALDPTHRPAIDALAALHAASGDWPALVRDKRALKSIAPPDEHAALLEEIGDLQFEKVGEAGAALATYNAALAVDPARRSTLHKVLDLHTKEKNWRAATETLVRLAEIETDSTVRAKLLYTA
ncbi:MAG: tetratricopeptide repeat protein, partial [Verrucomicrobiota bacterium]